MDLGWFRCAFWISKRTLSVPGKWLWICWSDKLFVCVCIPVYASVHAHPFAGGWMYVCVYEQKQRSYIRFTTYCPGRKGGFLVLLSYCGNEHPWTWNRIHQSSSRKHLAVLSVADNTHAKCHVRTSVSSLWIWINCFFLMLFKPFYPPFQLAAERTSCVLLTVASGSQQCCTAVPWMRGYQLRDCVWYWDLCQMANAIWSAWHMVSFSDVFYFQTELQPPGGTSKNPLHLEQMVIEHW